ARRLRRASDETRRPSIQTAKRPRSSMVQVTAMARPSVRRVPPSNKTSSLRPARSLGTVWERMHRLRALDHRTDHQEVGRPCRCTWTCTTHSPRERRPPTWPRHTPRTFRSRTTTASSTSTTGPIPPRGRCSAWSRRQTPTLLIGSIARRTAWWLTRCIQWCRAEASVSNILVKDLAAADEVREAPPAAAEAERSCGRGHHPYAGAGGGGPRG